MILAVLLTFFSPKEQTIQRIETEHLEEGIERIKEEISETRTDIESIEARLIEIQDDLRVERSFRTRELDKFDTYNERLKEIDENVSDIKEAMGEWVVPLDK